MTRTLILAAALTLPALPALAQSHVAATHGALAGRSPVHSYKAAVADPDRVPQMHSLPAGKLPVYGRHAMIGGHAKAQLAKADRASPAEGQ